jgi:hypothetical protein
LVSLLIVVIGLAFIGVGIALGVLDGHPLGGMIGLLLGIGVIVVALILKDDQ